MSLQLPPHQYALLKVLAEGTSEPSIEQIAAATGLDQALVSAAAMELADERKLLISELKLSELKLAPEGGYALELQAFYLFTAVALALTGAGRFSVGGRYGPLN